MSNLVLRAEIVERLLGSEPTGAREEAQRLREAAIAALANVRHFMFEAYPSVLEDLGLLSTLRRYLQSRAGPTRVAVELSTEGTERRLPQPAELSLFRAAQEGLRNVDQHSGAESATLTVAFQVDAVEVRVDDDGRGFDPSKVTPPGESKLTGLCGVKALLAAAGGDLAIRSAPARGATITARVPF